MRLSSRSESMGSASLCLESTRKVVHFPYAHEQAAHAMSVLVAHRGRNVYYLKEDIERFADEALKIQSSGRDLLDLVNRCESLREVRSGVSVLYYLHHNALNFTST